MAFLPIAASKEIIEKYLRYLRTIFSINDPDYQTQLDELLRLSKKSRTSGLFCIFW